MRNLIISNKVLEKYFSFLTRFDNQTTKKLIIKLTDSIEVVPPKAFDINSLFGAWEDDRSSDEIIQDIRKSRVEKRDIEAS